MADEPAISRLSERQLACLRLVAQLKKTEQIADELGISPSTVNTHIDRAMTILGTRSRREAARMVAKSPAGSFDASPEKSPTEVTRLADAPADTPSGLQADPLPPVRNTLSGSQRIGLGVLALILLCLAIAGLGSAIEQLSAWRQSLAAARNH